MIVAAEAGRMIFCLGCVLLVWAALVTVFGKNGIEAPASCEPVPCAPHAYTHERGAR